MSKSKLLKFLEPQVAITCLLQICKFTVQKRSRSRDAWMIPVKQKIRLKIHENSSSIQNEKADCKKSFTCFENLSVDEKRLSVDQNCKTKSKPKTRLTETDSLRCCTGNCRSLRTTLIVMILYFRFNKERTCFERDLGRQNDLIF